MAKGAKMGREDMASGCPNQLKNSSQHLFEAQNLLPKFCVPVFRVWEGARIGWFVWV